MAASLGTALTPEQAKLLGRFARKVVVNYDGDRAGVQAAKRAIETLLAEDFEAKVLVLPNGADPDEFIRTEGVEAYHERRGKALPHIQFVLDQAVHERNLLRPADKAEAVEEVLPFVRAVRNGIQKREYFDIAMDSLRVEEHALRNELWQTIKAGAAQTSVKQRLARAAGAQPTIAEQRLLELLFTDEEVRRAILPRLEPGDYDALPTAAVFRALIEIEQSGEPFDAAAVMSKTETDEVGADLVPLLLMSEAQREVDEAADDVLANAESCLTAMRLLMIDRRINELGAELATAEREGNAERRDQLVLEHLEWSRRKKQLTDERGQMSVANL
jgi:DNA primase